MKIVFVGDSITNGKLGASFVDLISKDNRYHITNLGHDGDTWNLIFNRLHSHLKVDQSMDCIVLQGGYNDLLLPFFQERGGLFQRAYDQQLKKGCAPVSTEEFTKMLESHIRKIKEVYHGRLILLTIGCVGEKLDSELNAKRNHFNELLIQVAEKEKLTLVNTQIPFDAFLSTSQQSSYCLDNIWAITIWDRLFKKWDALSKKRGLHLTIDGVHLNTKGAAIFAESIARELHLK
ncbi:MAG: SGNH/GDSL hydrolase family protein [Bacteroidetes bacterium]|nr:SGNH/GDSL hydrolase family protein [Bacteroidota bacterium]